MLPITPATVRHVESAASNLTFSISDAYAAGSAELDLAIRDHATLRVEIAAIVFCALYNMAVTSQGPLDVTVNVDPARRQIGQGTVGNNAAHADSAAGRTDDLAAIYIKLINKNTELSPKKQDALKGMGFSEKEVKELIECRSALSRNTGKISELTEKINALVARLGEKKHVFDGTPLDDAINATNNLPFKVNLSTDKGLERRIRSEMKGLIREVMRAEKTPIEAIQGYMKAILAHFDRKITFYSKELASLDKKKQTESNKHKIGQNEEFLSLTLLQNGGTQDFSWNVLFCKYDRVNHRYMTPTKEDMKEVRGNYVATAASSTTTSASTAKRKLVYKDVPEEFPEESTVDSTCTAKRLRESEIESSTPGVLGMENLSLTNTPVEGGTLVKAPSSPLIKSSL